MNDKLITVAIPVYNVKRFLTGCLKSVINQSYRNLQIIIVDDGSNDGSSEICDSFSKIDTRIEVYHTANAGVSAARNLAINMTKGDLICFVDADDLLPADSINKLFISLIAENSDLCCGTWIKISATRKIYNTYTPACINIGDKKALSAYMDIEEVNGPVAKLYKMSIIEKHKLRFKLNVKICEDAVFNYQYIRHCNKVSVINEPVYIYNKINEASATHSYYNAFSDCCLLCAIEKSKNLSEDDSSFNSLIYQSFISRFIHAIQYILYYNLPTDEEREQLLHAYTIFFPYIKRDISKTELSDSEKVDAILKMFEYEDYDGIHNIMINRNINQYRFVKFRKLITRIFAEIQNIKWFGVAAKG